MNSNPANVEISLTWYLVVGALIGIYLLIYFRHKIQLKINRNEPTQTSVEKLYQDMDSKVIKVTHIDKEYIVLKDKTGLLLLDCLDKDQRNDDV